MPKTRRTMWTVNDLRSIINRLRPGIDSKEYLFKLVHSKSGRIITIKERLQELQIDKFLHIYNDANSNIGTANHIGHHSPSSIRRKKRSERTAAVSLTHHHLQQSMASLASRDDSDISSDSVNSDHGLLLAKFRTATQEVPPSNDHLDSPFEVAEMPIMLSDSPRRLMQQHANRRLPEPRSVQEPYNSGSAATLSSKGGQQMLHAITLRNPKLIKLCLLSATFRPLPPTHQKRKLLHNRRVNKLDITNTPPPPPQFAALIRSSEMELSLDATNKSEHKEHEANAADADSSETTIIIQRFPFLCPHYECSNTIFISDFHVHLATDHLRLPQVLVGANKLYNVSLDPNMCMCGLTKCHLVLMLADRISGVGEGEYKNTLPVMLMSTYLTVKELGKKMPKNARDMYADYAYYQQQQDQQELQRRTQQLTQPLTQPSQQAKFGKQSEERSVKDKDGDTSPLSSPQHNDQLKRQQEVKQQKAEGKALLLWLTCVVPDHIRLNYSITVWQQHHNQPAGHISHVSQLYSVRQSRAPIDVWRSGMAIVLYPAQMRKLTNASSDLLNLQVILH